MNPLLQIVRAGHCRATHQMFAIDALPLVQTAAGKRLTSWLLRYYRRYLRGAIDPDIRFRDFQNHVIHVRDGFWGGAPRVAHGWYDRLQRYLRQQRYADAAHAAGVLSHYFTDSIQPLNTGYSAAEEIIHAPLQWSIQRAYQSIHRQWQGDDLRVVFQLADGPGWLGAAMLHGAKFAHQRYDLLVDSYRLEAAVANPSAGIDVQAQLALAELFGLAITGWARVLERAASDAEAVAGRPLPRASRVWPFVAATACVPAAYWGHRIQSRIEDRQIEELVAEYRRTGKLSEHLPAEVDIKKRVIRVYRNERRYRLDRKQRQEQRKYEHAGFPIIPIQPQRMLRPQPIESLVAEAEDLKRLHAAGIKTIADLQQGRATQIADRLQAYWITADTIESWRREAALMDQVRGLTATAARIFIGAGWQDALQIAAGDFEEIYKSIVDFAATVQGRRCLQRRLVPTRPQVSRWVRQVKFCAMDQTGSQSAKAA